MKKPEYTIPYLIVGAGIIGLQIAYELLKKGISPDDIAVVEQNIFAGEHSSSRNSGVLHAGIYYPANSLKQQFCVEGNREWIQIARELNITIAQPGKFIVATTTEEVKDLEELFEFAKQKGVDDLQWRDGKDLSAFINVKKTFFSPSTGIIDISEAIKSLTNYIQMRGVAVLLGQKVHCLSQAANYFEAVIENEVINAEKVINCGGLYGVEIRSHLGLTNLQNYWVKGRYLKLNKAFHNSSLIYPLPNENLKGLGVHTSFGPDGIIRFGPDTLDVDKIEYSMDSSIIENMHAAISRVFKNVRMDELSLDYSGIRSKLKINEQIYTDFWIESPLINYWECLGIESPGLTSSPAIAKHVVSKILLS